MIYTELNWDIFLRGVIPFGAANIFIMVFIYFTLVRARIGNAYPFYAIFILCFIIFLCGPLINVMPIDVTKRWYDLFRNILLFSIGIPILICGLYTQANIKLARSVVSALVFLGVCWSLFFVMAPPLHFYRPNEIPWLFRLKAVHDYHIYYSQIILITCQLLIPCLVLLHKPLKKHVTIHIYGAIALYLFICLGNIFEQWELYYAGSSLTALIWGWAVYQDIQQTNEKMNKHYQHQNSLSIAQYAAPSSNEFAEFYPAKLNEAYPFRERAELIEAVCTASFGLINSKTESLLNSLKIFCQNNIDIYRIRTKEILFMLFDSVIYKSGNTGALITRLEQLGEQLNQSNNITVIDNILYQQANNLAKAINLEPNSDIDSLLVDKIKTFILAQYHKNISIADIVKHVGSSRSQIMKQFKDSTSQTINQYLIDVRINKAKSILLSKSVTETAFEVGFNNSAYFSTVFKKQTDMTPKEYQQKAKLMTE